MALVLSRMHYYFAKGKTKQNKTQNHPVLKCGFTKNTERDQFSFNRSYRAKVCECAGSN